VCQNGVQPTINTNTPAAPAQLHAPTIATAPPLALVTPPSRRPSLPSLLHMRLCRAQQQLSRKPALRNTMTVAAAASGGGAGGQHSASSGHRTEGAGACREHPAAKVGGCWFAAHLVCWHTSKALSMQCGLAASDRSTSNATARLSLTACQHSPRCTLLHPSLCVCCQMLLLIRHGEGFHNVV
jgi:hypothetical protein